TFRDIGKVIKEINDQSTAKTKIVINLCDGDEMNGIPGISVIDTLERYDLIYTGSNAYFYKITTSKIPMKVAFDRHHVPTPVWRAINSKHADIAALFEDVGDVLIVKPAISAGSMGLSIKNVVSNQEEF